MFSELLPNLKQFFWFFAWNEAYSSASISLSLQGASLVARVVLKDPAAVLHFSCPLPVQLDKTSVTIHQLNGGVEIRASVASVFPTAPVEPKASVADAKGLFCKLCQAPLNSSAPAFTKVADLPSDAWHELKDLWVCACTAEMLASSATMAASGPAGDFAARPGLMLAGASHILVHEKNLDQSATCCDFSIVLHDRTRRWVRLLCNRCLCPLGRVLLSTEASGDLQTTSDYRLLKHLVGVGEPVDVFGAHTVETQVSNLIVQAVKSHSSYRFVVKDEIFRRAHIKLNVMSWNSLVTTLSNQQHRYVVKVSFNVVDASAANQGEEIIYLPENEIADLQYLLIQRNELLPPSRQELNGQRFSFLYLLNTGD